MALNLIEIFKSSHKNAHLFDALKSIDFHQTRSQSKSLKLIEFETPSPIELKITRHNDFDIPASAQKFISNPVLLSETWDFISQSKIKVILAIPKIQTEVTADLNFEELGAETVITVNSYVVSEMFLVGSFVEEFVSKFWKNALNKDFETLNIWITTNQTFD
ncbi:MAG: DUF2505 family protein [Actinomycetota bacterium]|nr:DUF2505 family protein [Actinomycetota bacterium]